MSFSTAYNLQKIPACISPSGFGHYQTTSDNYRQLDSCCGR